MLTHSDNVASNSVAEGQVAGYSHENVKKSGHANTEYHDCRRSEVRVVANLVQYREHLRDDVSKGFLIMGRTRPDYILMTCIRKYDHWEAAQRGHSAFPVYNP